MNWFQRLMNCLQRHLNWTVVLGSLVYYVMSIRVALTAAPVEDGIDALICFLFVNTLAVFLLASMAERFIMISTGFFIAFLTIGIWCAVLSQKKRSLWWVVLASFIPLG